ncbi:MAG TPA: DUF5946 family protein [Thermoanaerobaculia bacterium]|nr:DUF5946 family protein [Thermoanaerobaculia bacterium]
MTQPEAAIPPGDKPPGTWRPGQWRVGALGGFLLYLDWSWPFWALLGFFHENGWRWLALGCVGVIIHAFAQATAARGLGLGTGSITFSAFGGYLWLKDLEPLPFQMEPDQRRRYAAMIFAGPLSNLVIFVALQGISSVWSSPEILSDFGRINLCIGLVRLIPLYPLDGAKLIYSWGRSSVARERLHVTLATLATIAMAAALLVYGGTYLGPVMFVMGLNLIRDSLQTQAEIERRVYPSTSARGTACPGCGEHLPPISGPTDHYGTASPACWARYVALAAFLEEHGGGPFGGLVVDAYAVQHPGNDTLNINLSMGIHLVTLYGVLERGVDPEKAPWMRERAARRGSSYYRLSPPSFRATPKIGSILEAPESERPARIEHYVRGVWEAWATEYRRLLGKWYDQEVVAEH